MKKLKVTHPSFICLYLTIVFLIISILMYIENHDIGSLIVMVWMASFSLFSLYGNRRLIVDLLTNDIGVFTGAVVLEEDAGSTGAFTVKSLTCQKQENTINFLYFPNRTLLTASNHIIAGAKVSEPNNIDSSITEFTYLKRSKIIIEFRHIGTWENLSESNSSPRDHASNILLATKQKKSKKLQKGIIATYCCYLLIYWIAISYFCRGKSIDCVLKNLLFCYSLFIPLIFLCCIGIYSCLKGNMKNSIWRMEKIFAFASGGVIVVMIMMYLLILV